MGGCSKMVDAILEDAFDAAARKSAIRSDVSGSRFFWSSKRLFDIFMALAALPVIGLLSLILLFLNPSRNPGPLFFVQDRMGKGGSVFRAIKFRTMLPADSVERGPSDPLETWRITALGAFLRRSRLDEFPQFINVLRGEMSVIGPRPDYIAHALAYRESIPGYAGRYVIRPGITGYAQVRLGYAEGPELTMRKTRLDHVYIRNAGWRVDGAILMRTLRVMRSGFGAK